MRYDVNFLN